MYYACNSLVALLKPARYVQIKKYINIIFLLHNNFLGSSYIDILVSLVFCRILINHPKYIEEA